MKRIGLLAGVMLSSTTVMGALSGPHSLLINSANAATKSEVKEVRIGHQIGLGYLQLDVMQDKQLIQKYAKKEGLGPIKVTYRPITNTGALADALLSGGIDLASAGPPPFITLWDKTQGNANVKMISALNEQPMLLNTSNPKIKSIKDFGPKDRVAVPAPKTSMHAILLGMAAEKALGPSKRDYFDGLEVPMTHPDAVASLVSGRGQVDAHFATMPYQYQELESPKVHTVISSYAITGGPSTITGIWTTSQFHDQNPKTVQTIVHAIAEATDFINKHPDQAAKIYIKVNHSNMSQAEVQKLIMKPGVVYTMTPAKMTTFTDYMHKVGLIKHKPASWKDLFFPEAYSLKGS